MPTCQEISILTVSLLQLYENLGSHDYSDIPLTHRILDPDLGGGALLDLGPYPLVWVSSITVVAKTRV